MIRQNWQMFHKGISDNMVDEIIKITGKTDEASTFNNSGSDIRKSRVAWVDNQSVRNMLYEFVDIANTHAFHVHIYKKADIQYTEYLSSEQGHYGLHHDIDWQNNNGYDRKLSVTVQLSEPSEYEGGNFVFDEVDSPDTNILKQKGTVLVFPSYLRHRVEPVTKGVRRSLVSWFEGPSWR
jgi:PKHD-type hydroxylase